MEEGKEVGKLVANIQYICYLAYEVGVLLTNAEEIDRPNAYNTAAIDIILKRYKHMQCTTPAS